MHIEDRWKKVQGGVKLIEFSELPIEKIEDYDKLYEHVGKEAIDDKVIDTLKKFLGTNCNRIVVEYPYHDKDFLSTYYCYYCL